MEDGSQSGKPACASFPRLGWGVESNLVGPLSTDDIVPQACAVHKI